MSTVSGKDSIGITYTLPPQLIVTLFVSTCKLSPSFRQVLNLLIYTPNSAALKKLAHIDLLLVDTL